MSGPAPDHVTPDRASRDRATPDRVVRHVEAFNEAVASGDWQTFATRFAPDARMSFAGVPAGPYLGRPAIADAYAENPPTEPMALVGDPTDERARFRWSSGGTGTMHLRWTAADQVAELTVAFD